MLDLEQRIRQLNMICSMTGNGLFGLTYLEQGERKKAQNGLEACKKICEYFISGRQIEDLANIEDISAGLFDIEGLRRKYALIYLGIKEAEKDPTKIPEVKKDLEELTERYNRFLRGSSMQTV